MLFDNYIYIDKKRIDSYYEQIISSSNNKYMYDGLFRLWPERVKDSLKIEEWNPTNSFCSLYEKTVKVAQHIRKSNQFTPKRNHPLNKGRDFVYYEETLLAQKVRLSDKISLWISEKSSTDKEPSNLMRHGHLILIQGYSIADTVAKFYGGWGTLQMLLTYKKINFDKIDDSKAREFNVSPMNMLRRENYLIEDTLNISVMYRIHATCRDIDNEKLISTLGYPIMISINEDLKDS